MAEEVEIDWQQASVAERIAPTKALHSILQALAKHIGTHFDVLLERAQGQPVSEAMDPHRNFRRGEIAWQRAAKIHDWLARNHFNFAQSHAPELFQHRRQSDWDRFVEQNAIVGRLKIVRLKQDLSLIERDDEVVPVQNTLRLTQRFCFELDTDLKGIAVAFQYFDRQWHLLPLGTDKRNPKARVKTSPQRLPRRSDGSPIGLRENDDTGDHVFAVLVS